jgi:hypothetical protein
MDPVSNMTARSSSVAIIPRHSDLMKDPYTSFYEYNNTREKHISFALWAWDWVGWHSDDHSNQMEWSVSAIDGKVYR